MSRLKMVVGLGNPGRRYENNRHNIGFRGVELYGERRGIELSKKQSKSLIGQGLVEIRQSIPVSEEDEKPVPCQPSRELDGGYRSSGYKTDYKIVREKVLLVKPQTFMNNSGDAVQSLASYYNIAPNDIMVLHDHMDLPTGKLRLRPGGGAGGQNGVRSIIQRLGGQDFPRLRIGVGRPPGRMDPAAYVLQDFRREEAETFGDLADTVIQIIDFWLASGIDAAMNQFNGRT